MSRDEEVSLVSCMAASLYAGTLADPACGFSGVARNKCIDEAEAMFDEIKRRDKEKHSLPVLR